MPSIQAVSYTVSAIVPSLQPPPATNTEIRPAAMKTVSAGTTDASALQAMSARVNAFIATDQASRTNGSRPESGESDAKSRDDADPESAAVQFDEAQTYHPGWVS